MPRLSLWKNAKTKDYFFQDRAIREAVGAGGTSFLIHKYLGPAAVEDGSDPARPKLSAQDQLSELDMQDLLFMENRDRIYDTTIYEMRGTYNVTDQDFDLSQFGLFLNADTLFITFHTNEMVERIGRKLMAGDVIEVPHLNDDLLLDAAAKSINKFYAVQDASRAAEGFGPTWWPHLWRVKVSPINDAQEYRSILGDPEDADSLKNALSTYQTEIKIDKAVLASAEAIVPNVGYPLNSTIFNSPDIKVLQTGGIHSNAVVTSEYAASRGDTTDVATGLSFPTRPSQGELFIRSDFTPGRLFSYRGTRWHRVLDVELKEWRRNTVNAGDFIQNPATTTVNNFGTGTTTVPSNQPLSKVFVKPKADN